MKYPLAIVVWLLVMGSRIESVQSTEEPSPATSKTGSPAVQNQGGPIVVAIVVDQLAAWVLRERIDKLPDSGGFARLRREGRFFQEMAYAHAVTETAPGHASLFTGKTPREHGIIANDILTSKREKSAMVADAGESSRLVGLDGSPLQGMGSSMDCLAPDAKSVLVATAFRKRYPKGQGIVAALSLKDRGALFGAGDSADYAIWFDPKQGGGVDPNKARGAFVTSKRYEASLKKSGLATFMRTYLARNKDDKRDGIERVQDQTWKGMDPAWLSKNAAIPGDSDYAGFIDSHTASRAKRPGSAFRALPNSDRLLLEMALQILRAESRALPAFLSVSLSANDYVGHLFGPDSWEAWDELRRLDETLAWFFSELDQLSPQRWSVVLSADHGTVPIEGDALRAKCGDEPKSAIDFAKPCSGSQARGARIYANDLKEAATAAAADVDLLDANGAKIHDAIAGVIYPYIYLTESARAATQGSDKVRARKRLASKLDDVLKRKFKGVHAIWDVGRFRKPSACEGERKDTLATLVCQSVSPDTQCDGNKLHEGKCGGDFYVVLKPGAFFDPDLVKGTGINHGSPYGYDRFVPMFVRTPIPPDPADAIEPKQVPFTRFHDELIKLIEPAPVPPGGN